MGRATGGEGPRRQVLHGAGPDYVGQGQ
jgi:hypothetical protein